MGLRLEALVVAFALIDRGEAIHEMRHLRAAALHETEAQLGKSIEHAAKHEIGERDGILNRIAHGAPETVTARGVMAREPPAAGNGTGIDRMNDNRNVELLGFSIERPKLLGIDIFLVERGITHRRVQPQLDAPRARALAPPAARPAAAR